MQVGKVAMSVVGKWCPMPIGLWGIALAPLDLAAASRQLGRGGDGRANQFFGSQRKASSAIIPAMEAAVSTADPAAVERAVQSIFLELFPRGDTGFVPRAFAWMLECFSGGCSGYQAVDTLYHDVEHTMQGTLCMARLLRGRHRANAAPVLSERVFQLGILAILLHDSGYLKRANDTNGTGAKYTATHVDRSADFAGELLMGHGYDAHDITAVQNMIRCTGVNASIAGIPFQTLEERIAGSALATADYLGQMAAADYVEKLPILYKEFAEAAQFSGEHRLINGFANEADLIRKTPAFWEKFVKPRLDTEFMGLYRFLSEPYPDGRNVYLERIETNIGRIERG